MLIDACAFEPKPLLTIDEALARIKTTVEPLLDVELIRIGQALGRVLAEAVHATVNIPRDNNAAMDGYAFSSRFIVDEGAFTLRLVGTSWAGKPFLGELKAGECVRIFTGAVVPEQADSVVMQEQVEAKGKLIHFPAHIQARQNIRAAGEDVKHGDVVCAYPKKLAAADLGLLAAAGIMEIPVIRPLKIVFFSTGDELTALGQPLAAGQIYDSNRYLLSGLLADNAYTVVDGGVLADNPEQIEAALRAAAKQYDIIITTGGASVGEADYIQAILARCGQVNFWKIAMKPGKPLAFGKIGASYFFGLPGNPLAVLAIFQQIVHPALTQLAGLPVGKMLRLTATCTSPLKKSAGRQEFQCGILRQDDSGAFFVESAGLQGSHLLSTISRANCYIMLPSDCRGVQSGEQVVVEPFGVFF
jgi:molybdopterin molybdotransferase